MGQKPSREELRPFGELLRGLRGGESLRELALAVNSSKSVLSRVERGEQLPDTTLTTRLDKHFGLSGALAAERLRLLHGAWEAGGEYLSPDAEKISILANVIGTRWPCRITKFGNRARIEIRFCPDRTAPGRGEIQIAIQTRAGYAQPGDNYAGISIAPILRPFDLSAYSQATLEYDARVIGALPATPSFEFKLHSKNRAHIDYVPIGMNRRVCLPLSHYAKEGVELDAVTEIVIAANSEKIGAGSRLNLTLHRVRWSAPKASRGSRRGRGK